MESLMAVVDERYGQDEELHAALRDAVVMLAENEPEDPFGALAAQYVHYSIRVSHRHALAKCTSHRVRL